MGWGKEKVNIERLPREFESREFESREVEGQIGKERRLKTIGLLDYWA
jgi:hypothetical protein